MLKDILEEYRKRGMRITDQRKMIVSLILQNPSSTCKEFYYLAHEKDSTVSLATVYRTIHSLEELGYLQRKNIISIPASAN